MSDLKNINDFWAIFSSITFKLTEQSLEDLKKEIGNMADNLEPLKNEAELSMAEFLVKVEEFITDEKQKDVILKHALTDFDLPTRLSEKNIEVHESIMSHYTALTEKPNVQKRIIVELCKLANLKSLPEKERLSLYKRFSKDYENFFGWEAVVTPGC